MTRAKKTRSLKRIHQVKTGSKQKLKRAADNDRQTGKGKKKNLSVYEKHLLELEKKKTEKINPESKPNNQSKKASQNTLAERENKQETPSFKQAKKAAKPKEQQAKQTTTENEPTSSEEDDIFSHFQDNKDIF